MFEVLFLARGKELMELEDVPGWCWSLLWIMRRLCHVLLVLKQPTASSLIIRRQIVPLGDLVEYDPPDIWTQQNTWTLASFPFMSELFVKRGENNPGRAKSTLGLRSPAASLVTRCHFCFYFGQICKAGVLMETYGMVWYVPSVFYMLSCTDGTLFYIYFFISHLKLKKPDLRRCAISTEWLLNLGWLVGEGEGGREE